MYKNIIAFGLFTIMGYNNIVMECWQSGNAPDSKSGEPSFPWRAGSNPVHSLLENP